MDWMTEEYKQLHPNQPFINTFTGKVLRTAERKAEPNRQGSGHF
ncbi:MAG: hypothetical protein U5K84_14270 [Alkalibacterium sp.]|nr:hypothetical protein [Alkalibacterium sp.]